MFLLAIILMGVAYLLGSLNSAILVCKAMNLPDPRSEGSGNPGATNVLRIAGKKAATLVLVGDMLKGFLPVLIASMIGVDGFWLACVALSTVVGHIFPFFFGFQGGKGVATSFGTLLVIAPWVAVISAIVWVIIVFITKYVSLASLVSAVLSILLILFAHTHYFLPVFAMTILIVWRHKENIVRLQAGTEDKINLHELK